MGRSGSSGQLICSKIVTKSLPYESFCPRFYRAFDTLLRIEPPGFGDIRKILERQEIQVHQQPLDLFLRILGLVQFKRADVELGRICKFPV